MSVVQGSAGPAPAAVGRLVGQRVRRKEDPRLLTGHGRYLDDVSVPGMLHAHFLRSDVARARIVRLDTSAAIAAEGVVAVLTASDLNSHLAGDMHGTLSVDNPGPLTPLADGDVRHVGDPLALIIATNRYLAEDAAELIEVDYETSPAVVDFERAGAEAGASVHPGLDSNVVTHMEQPIDEELQRIFDTAPYVITETIRQHRYLPVPDGDPRGHRRLGPAHRGAPGVDLDPVPPRRAHGGGADHRGP